MGSPSQRSRPARPQPPRVSSSTAAASQPTVRHALAARRSHRPRAGGQLLLATSRSSAAEQQASGSMLRPPTAAALLTRPRAPALQPERGLCDRCPSATPAHSWWSPQGRRASTTSSLSLSWARLRLCTLSSSRQLAVLGGLSEMQSRCSLINNNSCTRALMRQNRQKCVFATNRPLDRPGGGDRGKFGYRRIRVDLRNASACEM